MTTAAELIAQTDCADLRRANDELQRQNDILTGRCSRLNALLVSREREIDGNTLTLTKLRGDLAAQQAQHAAERAFDAGEIARLVAEIALLNETCDRIARAGMRDAAELPY